MQRTTCLPSTELANCSVRATAASLVTSVLISSTSGSTGTGLKKCSPRTRPGFSVAAASFMIGMLDVFDASTASGSVDDPVEFGEDLALDALVFDDRFDDQLTVRQVGEAGGELQLGQGRRTVHAP